MKEKSKLYDEYLSTGQMDIKVSSKIPVSVPEIEKVKDTVKNEMSDKEIQLLILDNLQLTLVENRSIRKNVYTIAAILVSYIIISILGAIIFIVSTH